VKERGGQRRIPTPSRALVKNGHGFLRLRSTIIGANKRRETTGDDSGEKTKIWALLRH
jgi:hypothetical protein